MIVTADAPKATGLTLYELAEEAAALDDLAALDSGEWTEEHEKLAVELLDKLVPKVDSFAGYVRTLEARRDACKEEKDRLAAREKMLDNRVKWLKAYAESALVRMQRNTIEGSIFTLARQKNSTPTVITPALVDALPAEFVRVVPEIREADKDKIARALKAGQEIPGCALEYGYHVRIR